MKATCMLKILFMDQQNIYGPVLSTVALFVFVCA